MDTNEQDGRFGANEGDTLHLGRTGIDFELNINTCLDTVVTKLITMYGNNKIVSNMMNAGAGCTGLLEPKTKKIGSSNTKMRLAEKSTLETWAFLVDS